MKNIDSQGKILKVLHSKFFKEMHVRYYGQRVPTFRPRRQTHVGSLAGCTEIVYYGTNIDGRGSQTCDLRGSFFVAVASVLFFCTPDQREPTFI